MAVQFPMSLLLMSAEITPHTFRVMMTTTLSSCKKEVWMGVKNHDIIILICKYKTTATQYQIYYYFYLRMLDKPCDFASSPTLSKGKGRRLCVTSVVYPTPGNERAISIKSRDWSAAPPIRPPSTSGCAKSSAALPGLQLPPYKIGVRWAKSAPKCCAR